MIRKAKQFFLFGLWIALLLIFATYQNMVCQSGMSSSHLTWTPPPSEHNLDVTFEFLSRKFACENERSENLFNSSMVNCSDVSKTNFTAVYYDGEIWTGNKTGYVSKIDILNRHVHPTERPTVKLRENETAKKLMIELKDAATPPKYDVWRCDYITTSFLPTLITGHFSKMSSSWSQAMFGYNEIETWVGRINHEVIGEVDVHFRELKVTRVTDEIAEDLKQELKLRNILGTTTVITGRLIGSCVQEDKIQILTENIQGTRICNENPKSLEEFKGTNCSEATKIVELLSRREDVERSGLQFLSNLLQLLTELEEKRLFISNLHGYYFTVSNNLMVSLNDISLLIYHGTHNLYSQMTCVRKKHCEVDYLGPHWRNESANTYLYSGCEDVRPYCLHNSCGGFNASLNTCGMAHWIMFPVFRMVKGGITRIHITNLINPIIASWPVYRRTAMETWERSLQYLYSYDKDKQIGGEAQRGLHVGLPARKPG